MWEDVNLPRDNAAPWETLVEQFAAQKLGEYDGAVFLCTARDDRERRETFTRAAAGLGLTAQDGREVRDHLSPESLAARPGRPVLFVDPSLEAYLRAYLAACPAGLRHLLLYTRRRGNGPSPLRSTFLDFWREQHVDIYDFGRQDPPPQEEIV